VIWAIRDPITKRHPIKEKGGRIIGYESVIEDDGVDDKRLFVLESEFASVIQVLERQGNTLSPVLRRAWDGRPKLHIPTKNSPAVASHPHISVIGHITIGELQRELTATDFGNGFANRFLFCLVRRSKLLPFGGAHVDLNVWSPAVSAAVQHAKTVDVIKRTDDADVLFSRHQSAAETERALLLLMTHGLAQREMVDTGGRPVERWSPYFAPFAGLISGKRFRERCAGKDQ
jgi:hypothetical protein